MSLSVIIRSRDEAARLRLTLASLARQSASAEIVVVNDGSCDKTRMVIEEAQRSLPIAAVHYDRPLGRSGAANAGARAASGEVLLFLDGDTLADPDLVRRHAMAHAVKPDLIGRGENFHLRCTRSLEDPESGTPRAGEEAKLERLPPDERERLRVTRAQITGDFDDIRSRASAGIYPGIGPRHLQELELDALRNHPDCSVLWAAASGSNLSVARVAFLEVGGFNTAMDINEHRELGLKLCEAGLHMRSVDDACSYHMTHRSGWRDPLKDVAWESVFYAAHPLPAVKLLSVFWASLSPTSPLSPHLRIGSLPALEIAARQREDADHEESRRQLGLLPLGGRVSASHTHG